MAGKPQGTRQQVTGDPVFLRPDLEKHRNHGSDPYPREILDLVSSALSFDQAGDQEPMDTNQF